MRDGEVALSVGRGHRVWWEKDWRRVKSVPRDHGPAGRTPPERNEAPELGLAASGSLLVVLSSDASVLLIIVLREVWVRCVQRILRVFGRLLLLSYALYNAAHCRYLTTAKSRSTRPMKNARRRGAAAAV